MRINIKLVVIIAVLLGIGIAAYVFVQINRGASVSISTENGAVIYITDQVEGEYKQVGTSNATFKVKEIPSRLYVKVVQGENESISGLYLSDNSSRSLTIPIIESRGHDTAYQGAVFSPLLRDKVGYGIEPTNYEIVRFGLEDFIPPRPDFIGIPFLRSIKWIDEDNFIFHSFREGPGAFVNGDVMPGDYFGQKIVDLQGRTLDERALNIRQRTDSIAISGDTFYYLTDIGIYRSSDYGKTLVKISDFFSERIQALEATRNRLIRLDAEPPANYASEANGEGADDHPHSKVILYQPNGELTHEFDVFGEDLVGATQTNKRYTVATDSEIACTDEENSTLTPLPVPLLDAIAVNDTSYILAGSGLWQVSSDCLSLQKVSGFSSENIGLKESLLIDQNTILFGIQPRPNSTFQPYTARVTVE